MRLKIEKSRLLIIPENEQDEGYLEVIFDLKNEGDFVKAKRVNAYGLSAMAYIEIEKEA